MFFDSYGYPRPNGATDFADSSHLAGLLAVTKHPQAVDCSEYVVFNADLKPYKYVRHITENRYDFSRDQAVMLMSGLIAQGHNEYVNLKYITGRDLIPPSVRGLVRIAQGKNPQLLHRFWLKCEIYWHSYLQPLDEPFQLLAMILTYDNFNGNNELLKLWTSKNNLWRWSIKRYLCELDGFWRNEKELAEYVINFVENRLNG